MQEGIGEPCTSAVWLVCAGAKQAHSKAQYFLSGIVLRDAYKSKAGRLSTSVVFTNTMSPQMQRRTGMYQYLLNTSTWRRKEWKQNSSTTRRRRSLRKKKAVCGWTIRRRKMKRRQGNMALWDGNLRLLPTFAGALRKKTVRAPV